MDKLWIRVSDIGALLDCDALCETVLERLTRVPGDHQQRGSADALGQRDDDPFRPPEVGHPPNALVLADATDQSVALSGCPIDSRLQVVECASMSLHDRVAQPGAE